MTADSITKTGIWVHHLTKEYLDSPELYQMIHEKKLTGINLNLEALYHSLYYQQEYNKLIELRIDSKRSANKILRTIFCDLARKGCKNFEALYKDSLGVDGYVCVPLSPDVALDTRSTIKQATDFWKRAACRNLMISVPATKQGIPAIRQLLTFGINVNATTIYSLKRYQQLAEAYITALEMLVRKGKRIDRISSVASVKTDSIDCILDMALRSIAAENKKKEAIITPLLGSLGKATAILIGEAHNALFSSPRFQALEIKGANPQGIVWVCDDTNSLSPDIFYDFSPCFNIRPHFQVRKITKDFEIMSEGAGKPAFPDVDLANKKLQLANQLLGFSFTDLVKKMENDILSGFSTNYKKLTAFIDSQRTVNDLNHNYLQQGKKLN